MFCYVDKIIHLFMNYISDATILLVCNFFIYLFMNNINDITILLACNLFCSFVLLFLSIKMILNVENNFEDVESNF